jgi:ligand-binding sensor domain-containing protein
VPKDIKSAEKPGGVAGFDGREWRRLDVAGAPTDARCVAFDAQGRLWAGTNDGVAVWDGRSWTLPMKNDDQLPSKTVRALAVDQKGDIWMATYHGLARYDGKAFTRYNRTNSGIPADDIRSVAVDRSGAVWIGAAFSGLAKFDGAAWTLFSTDNSGLPHDDVYSLYFDRGGHLWVGAGRWDEKRPKGYRLATFDGKNWRTFAASDLNPAPKSER